MNRARFDPFGDLSAFRDNLGRLLEEQSAATRGQSRVWQPPMDIVETQDEWCIRLDLPGLAKDSIDIQMTGEQLTVRGERKEDRPETGHLVHSERPAGAFVRTVTLGAPIKADGVQAGYRDGVLTITLPKAEELKPRRVEVKAEG